MSLTMMLLWPPCNNRHSTTGVQEVTDRSKSLT
jgi:hypothetical protein